MMMIAEKGWHSRLWQSWKLERPIIDVAIKEVADISGVVLTKMDGTAKGGIAVAVQAELHIPVKYIGVGEHIDDLQKFVFARNFVLYL